MLQYNSKGEWRLLAKRKKWENEGKTGWKAPCSTGWNRIGCYWQKDFLILRTFGTWMPQAGIQIILVENKFFSYFCNFCQQVPIEHLFQPDLYPIIFIWKPSPMPMLMTSPSAFFPRLGLDPQIKTNQWQTQEQQEAERESKIWKKQQHQWIRNRETGKFWKSRRSRRQIQNRGKIKARKSSKKM